jgi:ankyrin repeat protein
VLQNKETALMLASYRGHLDIVKYILSLISGNKDWDDVSNSLDHYVFLSFDIDMFLILVHQ